jgi:hypothetical protein
MSGFAFVEYAELKVSLVQKRRARPGAQTEADLLSLNAVQDAEEAVSQLSGKDFLGER